MLYRESKYESNSQEVAIVVRLARLKPAAIFSLHLMRRDTSCSMTHLICFEYLYNEKLRSYCFNKWTFLFYNRTCLFSFYEN